MVKSEGRRNMRKRRLADRQTHPIYDPANGGVDLALHPIRKGRAVSCPPGGQADDVQSLQEDTAALLKRLGLDLPTYYDPDGGTQHALGNLIALDSYPTTVLLDRRSVIRAVWVGYRPGMETEMERYIGAILDEENKPLEKHHGGTENAEGRK